mgnify:CR=1 FL=1
MDLKQYINNYGLKKNKVFKNYLLGKEDNLFLTNEHDDITKLMSSNKKEFRRIVYRFNYFLALFVLLISIFFLPEGFAFLLFLSPLFIKPITHYFALKNKTIKKNIYIYRKYYEVE